MKLKNKHLDKNLLNMIDTYSLPIQDKSSKRDGVVVVLEQEDKSHIVDVLISN